MNRPYSNNKSGAVALSLALAAGALALAATIVIGLKHRPSGKAGRKR